MSSGDSDRVTSQEAQTDKREGTSGSAPKPPVRPAADAHESPKQPSTRILLVDPDDNFRTWLSLLMRRLGFAVETANDGIGALELLRATPFDLMISDLEMPRMDGMRLIQEIRSTPGLAPQYAIMLTSKASLDAQVAALTTGYDDFLTKSCTEVEIVAKVVAAQRMLTRHHALSAAFAEWQAPLMNEIGVHLAKIYMEPALDTARDYLKKIPGKTWDVNEHPATVAAGVVALAVGASLIDADIRRHEILEQMQEVIEAMLPRTSVPLPPQVLQARRNAEAREALFQEFGAVTSAQVGELAGSRSPNRAALAHRWKTDGRIFAVPHHGVHYFPGFQFSRDGQPLPVISNVLTHLSEQRSGWELALWFTSRNGWLGGQRPVDLLENDPDAVIGAAARETEERVF